MTYILTAMQREADALKLSCSLIGIGASDLPETTEEDIIINVGYCGADGVEPGTIVEPNEVRSYETGEGVKLPIHFDIDHALCFTSENFVSVPCTKAPAIYDMELMKIVSLQYKELYVLKIVSDNLDEDACERFADEKAWETVRNLLKDKGLISVKDL